MVTRPVVDGRRRYYLAEFRHPDTLKKDIYPVTSMGWTKDGYHIASFAMVWATSIKEAREKFRRGEMIRMS